MKALQILEPEKFKIVEVDDPTCGDDEIIIRLEYAAICNQNDYKIFYGLYGDLIKYPCNPGVYGHEGVGRIIEKGKNVKDLELDDRVVIMLEGGPMLYSELVLRKADTVVQIDKKVAVEEAAVLELFGCANHCCNLLGDINGKSVAVSGTGPAGLALLQLLGLKTPSELVAIDINNERLEVAKALGADRVINISDSSNVASDELESIVDIVVDATGVPEAIQRSFELAASEVMIFGFTNKPFLVDQSKWFAKEMVIRNSKVQDIEDLRQVVSLLEDGKISAKEYVSGVMSFEEYDKAVEKVFKKEAVKILLKWD